MKMRYNVSVYGKHIRLNFIMARRKAAGERPRGAVVVPRFNERGSANEESYHIIAHCCHGVVAGGHHRRKAAIPSRIPFPLTPQAATALARWNSM